MKKVFKFILIAIMCTNLISCIVPNAVDRIEDNENSEQKLIDQKLYEACYFGNLEAAKEAIADGANLDEMIGVDSNSNNPYILSRANWNPKIAQYLILNGANPNHASSKTGFSLVMWEAWCSNPDGCAFLLENGADATQQDKDGLTALEYAVNDYKVEDTEEEVLAVIKILLEYGCEVTSETLKRALMAADTSRYKVYQVVVQELINNGYEPDLSEAMTAAILGNSDELSKLIKDHKIIDEEIDRILLFASAFGTRENVELLIENGANINTIDYDYNNPLNVAVKYDNFDTVKYLVERNIRLEQQNRDDNTPLLEAIERDYFDIVKYLLESGCNVNYRDEENYYWVDDPYCIASRYGCVEILKYLEDNWYETDAEKEGIAFSIACEYNCLKSIEYFVEKGLDPNMDVKRGNVMEFCTDLEVIKYMEQHGGDIHNKHILDLSAKTGNYEVCQYLIEQGADINQTFNDDNDTPICNAILMGHMDIVKLMIENGAEITYSVLKSAAQHQSRNIFLYILDNCEDVNLQNDEGWTVLMYAAARNDLERVQYLVEYGADINIANNDGETALDIARDNNYGDVVKYLKGLD